MVTEFDAQLQKGENRGAWTCVVLDDVPELFGTRGLVKIRGEIDGQPFTGALMAQGDGAHRLPVKAALRDAIGKQAGDTVHVRIDERIANPEQWPKSGPASYFPSIEQKYGRSIADWQVVIREAGLERHMEIVSHLKSEYGMGHGHANALVGWTLAGNLA